MDWVGEFRTKKMVSGSWLVHQICHRHGPNSVPAQQLKSPGCYAIFIVFFKFLKETFVGDNFNPSFNGLQSF
jgi:hypothetical protein